MHEAFADYFSAALADDGAFAEYVGIEREQEALRVLDGNEARCPESLTGEPHDDSLLFSSALWRVRCSLASSDENARLIRQ